MEEQVLKGLAVLGVLAAVIAGLALATGGRLQVAVPFDPDAIAYEQCGFGTPASRGYGVSPEYGARQEGEIFDRTIVWYAWTQDGLSFPVVGQAGLRKCAGALIWTPPDSGYYLFQINNGGGFQTFYQDDLPQGRWAFTGDPAWLQGDILRFPLFTFQIDGFSFCAVPTTVGCPAGQEKVIRDGAVLRVTAYAGKVGGTGAYAALAWAQDEVQLRSAIPDLEWNQGGYLVGETAVLSWRIPVDRDENGAPAYFLSVRDMNTGLPIAGYDRRALTGATSGAEHIPITAAMFSNNLATCQNRLRAEILSQLIVADQDDASIRSPDVQISQGPAPVVTAVTFDRAEYREGETVTVTWAVSGNVTKVHVTAHIGGFLVYDRDLDGAQRSVSFVAPRTGVLEVEVTAYDRCQPSDVHEEQATVGNVYPGLCTVYPDLPQCATSNLLALAFAVLAGIAVVAIFVLVLWALLALDLDVLPGFVALLLAIAAAAAAAWGLLSAGAFDVLLQGGFL